MRFSAIAAVTLMFAGAAAAQQTNTSGAPVSPTYVIVTAGCPGMLTAQQQAAGGATIWATASDDQNSSATRIARQSGLGIHVEFEAAATAVKSLELRVSYLPLGLRRMSVAASVTNSAAPQPQPRAKTFNLDRAAALRFAGDLLVGPAAIITQVHMVSATFADGSVWRAADDDACTVVPSRVMLVAQR